MGENRERWIFFILEYGKVEISMYSLYSIIRFGIFFEYYDYNKLFSNLVNSINIHFILAQLFSVAISC